MAYLLRVLFSTPGVHVFPPYLCREAGPSESKMRMRRCSHHSCTVRPAFNVEGSKQALYCKQHAQDGMVDVRHKRCSHHSCTTRPLWGVLADGTATVCAGHKGDLLDGPIINFYFRCRAKGCNKLSRWGLGGEQPTHCADHASLEEGLVRTVGTDRSKGISRSLSSRGLRKRLNGADGGTASKQARRAVPRTMAPVSGEEQSSPLTEPAKSRQIIWL